MSATFQVNPFVAAIFEFIDHGKGNLIIEAVAGSGKTTTIVELVKRTTGPAIFLAFNKAIAEELKKRLPAHVQARTFHSLCYSPVLRHLGINDVNQNKVRDLVRNSGIFNEIDGRMYGAFAARLVGLAKGMGLGALQEATAESFRALVDHHDITLESEMADESRGIELALKLLAANNASSQVDFDDLLYFAVLKGIRLSRFKLVVVDEGQDTNPIQRAVIRKILDEGGRLVVVGDAAQAIYGFRGADSDALNLIASDFAPCTRLPLSVTYRCARSIVARAKAFVPAITAREGAVEGTVEDMPTWDLTALGETDLVVCRTVKPLIQLGHACLRARKPVRILGRDIGEGLKSLIRKCAGNGSSADDVDHLVQRLEVWKEREMEKAIAKGLEDKAEMIADKADAVMTLVGGLDETNRTVAALIAQIDTLFTDTNHRTTLATIHKAKGLEADTVFWLNSSACPSRWAKKPWQQQQEQNLMYVAITRAKSRLVTIEMEGMKK